MTVALTQDAAERPAPPAGLDADRIALFLDFDGCLVEIAPTPDGVTVPASLGRTLRRAQDRLSGRLAILTGRSVETLRAFLPGYDGPVYGSHGAELGVDGQVMALIERPESLDRLAAEARDACARLPGCTFEPKPLGFALHFRQAPEQAEAVRSVMTGIVERNPGLRLQPAKMALEVKPLGADKGTALGDAMRRFRWDATPVAIGDDATDERAFEAADLRGGFGIKVGAGETGAAYRLPSPDAVHTFLMQLTEDDHA